MRPRLAWVDAAAIVVPALVRFVDGDEGVYAYASRLAWHGQLPYRNFFYEQTPVLSYVYGAWIGLTGESSSRSRAGTQPSRRPATAA